MAAIHDVERFSMAEVARKLRVHVATVWRWTLRGVRGRKLKKTMVGGRAFVLMDDLSDFLGAADAEIGRGPNTTALYQVTPADEDFV